jgi:prolyl-tRNA editing enzyme YbaK/EbsC (Cys-tRNA(Pro) deacylase)
MTDELSSRARKVQDSLKAKGLTCQVVEMKETTRTAAEAAQAVGCRVGQIVKSIIFKGKHSQMPILVVTSGANRVNEKTLSQHASEPIKKADAEFVREKTGFSIGGVPPLGHRFPLKIYIDQDLLQYTEIWAAAGTPHAVFKLSPEELKMITNGKVICVK